MTAQEQQSCRCSSEEEQGTSTSPCLDLIMQARLARRQLSARETEAPSVAARLLGRLLHITACSKGALLVPVPTSTMEKHAHAVFVHFPVLPLSSTVETQQWYLLASQEVSIEDVRRAVAYHDSKRLRDQFFSVSAGYAFYHLPITTLSQAAPERQTSELEAIVRDEAEAHGPYLPPYAILLLFEKDRPSEETGGTSHRSGFPTSLPACVQEAAGTVLMMLFLALARRTSSLADPFFFSEGKEQQTELQATLSHELRSPLAAIKGYVGTLLRHEQRLQPEERHEFLLAIDDASTRLTAIIEQLLEWSGLETGAVLLAWSQVNVAALARESLLTTKLRWEQELHSSAVERTFLLSILDEEGLPTMNEPVIEADQQRLREVLEQVLHNALIYSPEGGAIEVLVRPVPRAECQAWLEEKRPPRLTWPYALTTSPVLEISVRDQGIGIPQHAHERIFDRFGRVDMSLTREVNGLGLGLAICQRIVALHQGVIWVESEVGKGSTFHIWFPYKKEEGW